MQIEFASRKLVTARPEKNLGSDCCPSPIGKQEPQHIDMLGPWNEHAIPMIAQCHEEGRKMGLRRLIMRVPTLFGMSLLDLLM